MKLLSKRSGVYAAITFSMICWSFSFIWTRMALESFPPVTLITVRLMLASLLLFAFAKFTGKFRRLDSGDWKYFLVLSFFEPFLYYIGETYGLTLVKPTLAAVIITTIPVFAPIFAFVFLKERFTFVNMGGILVSMAGVYLIMNKSAGSENTSSYGVALLFLAVMSAIVYGLILRKIPEKYSATNIIFYQSSFGLLYFAPTLLIVDFQHLNEQTITFKSLGALFMLTVFASVIAFVLFADVVRKIGITKSQVFTNLIPVFTALFSWMLFNENINYLQWFGVFVVILGVFISQSKYKMRSS